MMHSWGHVFLLRDITESGRPIGWTQHLPAAGGCRPPCGTAGDAAGKTSRRLPPTRAKSLQTPSVTEYEEKP